MVVELIVLFQEPWIFLCCREMSAEENVEERTRVRILTPLMCG